MVNQALLYSNGVLTADNALQEDTIEKDSNLRSRSFWALACRQS